MAAELEDESLPSPPLHRTRDRRHLTADVRVERLEEDNDGFEFTIAELGAKLDRANARLTGMVVSTSAAAVLLVANLVASHWGGH